MAAAFEWPADGGKRRIYEQLFGRDLAPGSAATRRHFLVRDGGRPAASSSVYLVGGHAFVTNIGAAPWARGRGLGTAATVATLRHAAFAPTIVPRSWSPRWTGAGSTGASASASTGSCAGSRRWRRFRARSESPPTFEGGDDRRVVLHNAPRARWSGNAREAPTSRRSRRGSRWHRSRGRRPSRCPARFRSARVHAAQVDASAPSAGGRRSDPGRPRDAAGPPYGWIERRRRVPRRARDVAPPPPRLAGREWARLDAQRSLGPTGAIRYLGEIHRLRIVADDATARRSTVLRVGGGDVDELHLVLAARDRRPAGDVLRDWLRARARTTIEREIERRAPALGVTPVAVTVRDQRTRWGSAARSGRLSLSWRLILAPPEALQTVVIHELAHLRVFGHGPEFWALVGGLRPDHRHWRRWLREHALELHMALEPLPVEAKPAVSLGADRARVGSRCGGRGSGGDEGTRTPDPRDANAVLSQLSYIPTAVTVAARLYQETSSSPEAPRELLPLHAALHAWESYFWGIGGLIVPAAGLVGPIRRLLMRPTHVWASKGRRGRRWGGPSRRSTTCAHGHGRIDRVDETSGVAVPNGAWLRDPRWPRSRPRISTGLMRVDRTAGIGLRSPGNTPRSMPEGPSSDHSRP